MALDTSFIACTRAYSDAGCLQFSPPLLWSLQASDLITTMAYLSIPAMILHIVFRRTDVALRRVFVLFALFIFVSGLSHLSTFLTLWYPVQPVSVLFAVATAVSSLIAALALLKLMPKALSAPSRDAQSRLIARLEHEVVERKSIEEALRQARDELENRVQERTAELFRRNAELQAQIIEHNNVAVAFRQTQLLLDSAQRLALSSAGFDTRRATADLLSLLAENHPFPASAMYRQDRRTGRFMCMAMHGMPQDGFSSFQFSEGMLTQAAQTGATISLPCIDRTASEATAANSASSTVGLLSEALVVPVMYQNTCLSILVLAGTRPFTAAEISFVESLRTQLGVAQHNLRLYADSKRLANELHTRNIEIAQKNLQLQDISRTKSEFVANMSHELRTPLNAVLGFTGTLLMRLPGPLTDDQEKQLRTIQSSARHLLSLINDLLDVEKIESGKFDIRLEEVVLQSVIREVFDTLQPLAAQKKLDFKLSLPKADIKIQTDRRALSQMLINLLNNAIKFTEEGHVMLQLSRRRAGNLGTVEVMVSDTGIGILPERQGQLFQAFTQLDASSTRSFDGTGLGLYLSRRLATLVGGHLNCKSQYGKGSVFTLALPMQMS
jgi:signal transduction histidine kinase